MNGVLLHVLGYYYMNGTVLRALGTGTHTGAVLRVLGYYYMSGAVLCALGIGTHTGVLLRVYGTTTYMGALLQHVFEYCCVEYYYMCTALVHYYMYWAL